MPINFNKNYMQLNSNSNDKAIVYVWKIDGRIDRGKNA